MGVLMCILIFRIVSFRFAVRHRTLNRIQLIKGFCVNMREKKVGEQKILMGILIVRVSLDVEI